MRKTPLFGFNLFYHDEPIIAAEDIRPGASYTGPLQSDPQNTLNYNFKRMDFVLQSILDGTLSFTSFRTAGGHTPLSPGDVGVGGDLYVQGSLILNAESPLVLVRDHRPSPHYILDFADALVHAGFDGVRSVNLTVGGSAYAASDRLNPFTPDTLGIRFQGNGVYPLVYTVSAGQPLFSTQHSALARLLLAFDSIPQGLTRIRLEASYDGSAYTVLGQFTDGLGNKSLLLPQITFAQAPKAVRVTLEGTNSSSTDFTLTRLSLLHTGTPALENFYLPRRGGQLWGDLLLPASKLIFGSDTNLYRSAADTLKTDDSLVVGGTVQAPQFVSTVPSGTAPFQVNSTTAVANLNADLLDGYDSSAFPRKAENASVTGTWTFAATPTLNVGLKLAGGMSNWTASLWRKAVELDKGQALVWRTRGGLAIGLGVTIPENTLYFITSSADDNSAGAVYPIMFDLQNGRIGVGTTAPGEKLELVGGNAKATQFISTASTGTAPLVVSSTTVVGNLNADLLDGLHATSFARVDASSTISQPWTLNANLTVGAGYTLDGVDLSVFKSAYDVHEHNGSDAPKVKAENVLAKPYGGSSYTTDVKSYLDGLQNQINNLVQGATTADSILVKNLTVTQTLSASGVTAQVGAVSATGASSFGDSLILTTANPHLILKESGTDATPATMRKTGGRLELATGGTNPVRIYRGTSAAISDLEVVKDAAASVIPSYIRLTQATKYDLLLKGSDAGLEVRNASDDWYLPFKAGNTVVNGSLSVSGSTTISGNLSVMGSILGSAGITGDLLVGGNLSVSGSILGNASSASKWQTARTLSLTGTITGSVSIDGSADVSLATSIANGSVTGAMLASGAAVANLGYTPVNKAGDTMSGLLTLSAGASTLALKAGSQDHTYLSFFARTAQPNTRSGYFGYQTAGSSELTLTNDIGDFRLTVNGAGRVYINSTASSPGIELGNSTSNTPYIDFHSSGNPNDYDARIVAQGGSASNGTGTLTVQAGMFAVPNLVNNSPLAITTTAGAAQSINARSLRLGSDYAVLNTFGGGAGTLLTEGGAYIHAQQNRNAPAISLAIGDDNTGLNWGGDGVIIAFANNTQVFGWSSSQVVFYSGKQVVVQGTLIIPVK